MARSVTSRIGGVKRPLIVERDPVVGFADFQAAVVVRAHAGRQLGIDDVVDALDDAGADGVDAVLVEADDERRDGAILGNEIAANEIVFEGAASDVSRVLACQSSSSSSGRTSRPPSGNGVDDRGGRQAVDPLHGFDALDVAGDVSAMNRSVSRENRRSADVGLERNDERPRSAELLAETLVVAIHGVVFREPGGDVVVDVGDVGARDEEDRAAMRIAALSGKRQR